MILIRREIYIINNLSIKTLINIDIIKLESLILNIYRDITIISFYNFLEILILIIVKDIRINIIVISKVRYIIPTYSFITISIENINLS